MADDFGISEGNKHANNTVKGRINSIAKGKENSRAKKQTILI